MTRPELEQIELLADVDELLTSARDWIGAAPAWPPAGKSRALMERLLERAQTLRVRLDTPLVLATLGGTGTGKSALVNALVGATVSNSGRQRPTTRKPVLICRADITPEMLGIDPRSVETVVNSTPTLRDLVIIDCPDPDTTEDREARDTNLAQLHALLPHCDVLLVTTTQQKYRSAVVSEELAAAAVGARLVFVQTHADVDDDIREDWARVLSGDYATGDIFFVDSPQALRDAEAGRQPRGEMGRLVALLEQQLAPAAGNRIRRANFLDLFADTLAACRASIDQALPSVRQLERAIDEARSRFAAKWAQQVRRELLDNRRMWESRLLAEVTTRWGFSPWSCLLRAYQGLSGVVSGATLMRVRTPSQLALWGLWEGGRRLHARLRENRADATLARIGQFPEEESELRTAAIIVEGYAVEAGFPRAEAQAGAVSMAGGEAGSRLLVRAGDELQASIARLAGRHTGAFTRWRYEALLLIMLLLLAYRFVRNFFYDSWLAPQLGLTPSAAPLLGVDFFVGAGLCLVVWCGLLLWAFCRRLRQGLTGEVDALQARLTQVGAASGLFDPLEQRARKVLQWRVDLDRLSAETSRLRERLSRPETLGRIVTDG